jgi:membrane protease YdiL (CAAX protease family)
MTDRVFRPLLLFIVALLVFTGASSLYPLLDRLYGLAAAAPPWTAQAVIKSALLIVSLVLIAADRRRSFADYGFRAPLSPRWLRQILLGGAIGSLATTLIIATPAEGMRATLAGFGLLDLVLWIWLYSTFSEEIFTRGWYQTAISSGEKAASASASASAPVAWSAILFGTLHFSLLVAGADLWTVVIIVSTTTALGFVAASARQRSGSLWPAIVAHLSFNVAGTFTGIILTIISMINSRPQ